MSHETFMVWSAHDILERNVYLVSVLLGHKNSHWTPCEQCRVQNCKSPKSLFITLEYDFIIEKVKNRIKKKSSQSFENSQLSCIYVHFSSSVPKQQTGQLPEKALPRMSRVLVCFSLVQFDLSVLHADESVAHCGPMTYSPVFLSLLNYCVYYLFYYHSENSHTSSQSDKSSHNSVWNQWTQMCTVTKLCCAIKGWKYILIMSWKWHESYFGLGNHENGNVFASVEESDRKTVLCSTSLW